MRLVTGPKWGDERELATIAKHTQKHGFPYWGWQFEAEWWAQVPGGSLVRYLC